MKLCLNDMLLAFSNMLNWAEEDYYHVSSLHCKRVAYFSLLLGKYFQFNERKLDDLFGCAILHDNGLTEFYHYNGHVDEMQSTRIHCEAGEDNIKYLKFYHRVKNVIKYHHEMADGSGPFHKTSDETPLLAQIIHIIDWADIKYDLQQINEEQYFHMIEEMKSLKDSIFSKNMVESFIKAITYERIKESQNDIENILKYTMNHNINQFNDGDLLSVCYLFVNIIDSKSPFTKSHSLGVANKVARMCMYYCYDQQMIVYMFFAGAMHDVGKLIIDRDILEKPDHLTDDEYIQIQSHPYQTYLVLKDMNMGDIVHWAAYHHEKLDGSGYPFGKTENELDFNDRLISCCDIYQALREERSYKKAMTHEEAIDVMKDMAEHHKIDSRIVNDMEKIFQNI